MPILTRALSLILCLALWLSASPVPVRAAFSSDTAFSKAETPAPAFQKRALPFPTEATGNLRTVAAAPAVEHRSGRFLADNPSHVPDSYGRAADSTPNTNICTGEQLVAARGLYYLRARLMNPLTGRFWSADSYEGSQSDPQSLHKYLYCGGDGVNCIDPNGNASLTEVMVTAAIGATIGALVAVNVTSYLNPNVTEDELWKAAEYGAVTGALGGVGFGVKSASLFIQAIRVLTSAGLTLDSGLSAIQAQGEKERKVYAAAAVLGLWGTFTAARPLSVAST